MLVAYYQILFPNTGTYKYSLLMREFYVQKYIAHLVACSGPLLVRDGSLGASAFVKLAY